MQSSTQPAGPAGVSTAPGHSRIEFFLAIALIALLSLISYANTFHVPFYFDDRQGITDNKTIDILWPPWKALHAPTEYNSGAVGRPIVNLSLAVNYEISESFSADHTGLDPFSYHIFNLAVHVLTAWLLLAVLWRTLRQPALAPRFGAAAFPLACVIATVWAVHPLLSETVTNAIQRNESMVAMFYLFVIYCLIRSADPARSGGRLLGLPKAAWWQALAVLTCFIGVATKEVMFSAPLMALLYDRTFLAGTFLRALARRWQYYLGMCLSWILLGYLVHHASKRGGTVGFNLGMTAHDYLLKQCEAVVHYFRLAFWPHPLILDYGEDVVTHLSAVWPQALLLVALAVGTFWALWRKPVLGFAGAWVFIILAPSSSILPLTTQTEAEHRMYLPLAAIVALVMLGAYTLIGKRLYVAAGLLTIALMGATYARNQDYRTERAMWKVNVADRPQNYRAHYDFGCALMDQSRYIEASSEFINTINLKPDYPEAHCNLGACLENLGDEPGAMKEYEAAITINADDVQSNYNLGCIYWNRLDYPKAVDHYRIAVEYDPDYAEAWADLGAVLVLSDQNADAIDPLKTALDFDPDNTTALDYYGMALDAEGLVKNAIAVFRKGIALAPDNATLHKHLAVAYADDNQLPRAIAEDAKSLDLLAGDAETHYNYGTHLAAMNEFEQAVKEFKEAIRLRPGYPDAENDLGNALVALKRRGEAEEAFAKALELKPDFAEAHFNLGNAYLSDNRLDDAEKQFRAAITDDPDYAQAYNDLGSVLMMERRYLEATVELQQALRIDPDYSDAHANFDALQAILGGN